MATDRNLAKASIKPETPEDSDPELGQALSDASGLRVALEREKNRHVDDIEKGKRGFIGSILGDSGSAPLAIGFLALIFGGISWAWCLYMAQQNSADVAFWSSQAEKAMAFSATALGFVFGRSTS